MGKSDEQGVTPPAERSATADMRQKTALTDCEAAFKKSNEAGEHPATAEAFRAFRAGWYARDPSPTTERSVEQFADDMAEMDEARRLWHRRCGSDGSPCPSSRECTAFDLGFKAALIHRDKRPTERERGYERVDTAELVMRLQAFTAGMRDDDEGFTCNGPLVQRIRRDINEASRLLAIPYPANPSTLATLSPIERYGLAVLDAHREDIGDLDGGYLQDEAERCGLLESIPVTEACGEACRCAEYGDFPQDCLRLKKEFEPKMSQYRATVSATEERSK